MIELTLDLHAKTTSERRAVCVHDLLIAGWTGRDPHKVQEHIDELAALGVTPPATTPCFYRAGAQMITTGSEIDCLGDASSGEAEYLLLVAEDGGWWVGLGSDHTDRKVESYSIPVSKQMCPKPIAAEFWRFDDVASHWDELTLKSWVEENGVLAPYQAGGVAAMLHPRDTLAAYAHSGCELRPGTLMFGGTLPVMGQLRPHQSFVMELRDPVLDRVIKHRYVSRWLPA